MSSKASYLRRIGGMGILPVCATFDDITFDKSDFYKGGVLGVVIPAGDGKLIPATNAAVYELVKEGKFAQIFGDLESPKCEWEHPCQVIAISKDHYDVFRGDDPPLFPLSTLFPLKGGKVAEVKFGITICDVQVHDRTFNREWYPFRGHRFVIPYRHKVRKH